MVQVLYESYPYVRETESDLTPESILVDDVVVLLLYYYYRIINVLYGWNDHVREYTVLQLHTVRRNLMLVNTTLSPFFFRNCKVTFSRRNHVIGIHPTARAGLLLSCIVDSEVGQS